MLRQPQSAHRAGEACARHGGGPSPPVLAASHMSRPVLGASTTLARIKRADGSDPLRTNESIVLRRSSTCEKESDDYGRFGNG